MRKPLDNLGYFQFDDLLKVALLEHMEDDQVIEAVKEFRFEDLFGLTENLFLHSLIISRFIAHCRETKGSLLLD